MSHNRDHGEFGQRLPRTTELLEQARPDVFAAWAAGFSHKNDMWLGHAGCDAQSLFDLASLTKVLCTTTLSLLAEARGIWSIETPVRYYFPAFPNEKVKLSHLLDHSSGLPDWLPLHAAFHDEKGFGAFDPKTTPAEARRRYEEKIIASWREDNFEKKAVYSDLGFMLLGWALEKAASNTLDALFQDWVARAMGLASLQFLPISPDIVPTEDCPWRKHVLKGEVHDDNCFVLGGVAGHAGLFGNVGDVLKLGRLWLHSYLGTEQRTSALLPAEIVRKYWTFTHVPGSERSLGWDGVSRSGSSSTGKYFSNDTRGHLGFTGTSLWLDPRTNLAVTLLTNRVHPTRENQKIKAFRPVFHDTLLKEAGVIS